MAMTYPNKPKDDKEPKDQPKDAGHKKAHVRGNPDKFPTRDGQPYGDPLPPGVDPEDYVDPVQGATPQNVTKDDPRKNMSQAQIEEKETGGLYRKEVQPSDKDPRSEDHPAKTDET